MVLEVVASSGAVARLAAADGGVVVVGLSGCVGWVEYLAVFEDEDLLFCGRGGGGRCEWQGDDLVEGDWRAGAQ